MKKIVPIILTVLFVAVTLCACLSGCTVTRSLGADFEVPEGGYDGSDVTITFYHTMSATTLQPTLDTYIAEFNKLYPNIHVVSKAVGGYDDVRDQINTEIAAGNQPNLAYCYPDHVALYNLAGAAIRLDNLINSEIKVTHQKVDENGEIVQGETVEEIIGLTQAQKDDFIPGYYAEGKAFGDDYMYTLPFSKSTEVLYYNKTFFDANNIVMPEGFMTWEQLGEICRQIKAIDPDCVPLGYDSESNWFITMCEQYGAKDGKNYYTQNVDGNHFLFDNANNKNFVKMFREWYKEGLLTTQKIYGSYTSGLFVNTKPNEKHSYMSIGSSAGATHQRPIKVDGDYPFEVGITSIPQVDASKPKVISQGPSVTIFNKENKQEVMASWLFLKYLTTSVEFQAAFSMASGYVPVLKSVADNEVYAEFLAGANGGDNVAALSAKVCMEQEEAYYCSPAFVGSSAARDEAGALMIACLSIADDQGLDAAINKIFADAIKECKYQAGE